MLSNILSEAEYRAIPEAISQKIDLMVKKYIDSYQNSRGKSYNFQPCGKITMLECLCYVSISVDETKKIEAAIAGEVEKRKDIGLILERRNAELDEIQKKLDARDDENSKLKADIVR